MNGEHGENYVDHGRATGSYSSNTEQLIVALALIKIKGMYATSKCSFPGPSSHGQHLSGFEKPCNW